MIETRLYHPDKERGCFTKNKERGCFTKNLAGSGGAPVGEAWGLHWLEGDPWGLAHPDHDCYSSAKEVGINRDGVMSLGVKHRPERFHGREYPWAVGRVHSREVFKYGTFDFWFRLPTARGLWPAIWLYDRDNWPPEIDVVEGWTQKLRRWETIDNVNPQGYRRGLLNTVKPALVYAPGDAIKNVSGGVMKRGTWWWHVNPRDLVHARLVWTPAEISVYYEGHRELHVTDAGVLNHFNVCNGMILVLNNYVQGDYNMGYYYGSCHLIRDFLVYEVRYTPMGEEVAL